MFSSDAPQEIGQGSDIVPRVTAHHWTAGRSRAAPQTGNTMKIERKNSETTPVGTTFAPGHGRVAGPWPLRTAWLLWMVLACAVSVKAVMVPVAHSVYPCFEAGGRAWLAGIDLYPFCCEHEFRYGPVCAMALAPLARLPSQLGRPAVDMARFGRVLLVGPGVDERASCRARGRPGAQSIFLCLVLLGIVRSIWSGQSNLLVFALVALGVVADRRTNAGGWPP